MVATDQDDLVVREATATDAERCGRIFYEAFASVASKHNLLGKPASREFALRKVQTMLRHDGFGALVAERGGEVVGSAFVDERDTIAGVGPVSVAPTAQDTGVGRALMEELLQREQAREAPGVRLVQNARQYRSFALYAKLGFSFRAALAVLQGRPLHANAVKACVRPARYSDVAACSSVCQFVHGHARDGELRDAIADGTAAVVDRSEGLTGYATGLGYGWHAVAYTNEDIKALIGSAGRFVGRGVLVPLQNGELVRWCLDNKLEIVQLSTLMTIGLYNEPAGTWIPSMLY